jgi:hypothetical protein
VVFAAGGPSHVPKNFTTTMAGLRSMAIHLDSLKQSSCCIYDIKVSSVSSFHFSSFGSVFSVSTCQSFFPGFLVGPNSILCLSRHNTFNTLFHYSSDNICDSPTVSAIVFKPPDYRVESCIIAHSTRIWGP